MKRNYPELKLQIECIKWFDYQYPQYHYNRIKIDNEGKRTIIAGSLAKRAGLLAGASDIFISLPKVKINSDTFERTYNYGLFVEFKIGKGKQSENQKLFQLAQEKYDYKYEICRSFDDFRKIIDEYFNPK